MSRRGSDFAGLSVALVTPFTDGKLDVAKLKEQIEFQVDAGTTCLLYTSPSPRDQRGSRMPSSA